LALAAIHVAAGGTLVNDPLSAPAASSASPAAGVKPVSSPDAVPEPGASAAAATHPADELLAGDLAAAARIHDSTIAPLARYDSRYRTSLVETLSTWLACDASVSVAAARMYAHRHTIRYRLDRVRELSGLDTSSTADREQLALGLRARRVLADADALAPD
ncbi:MAG: helix-turn-helix domain-containing protein, partial [Gaiellales bacterium]